MPKVTLFTPTHLTVGREIALDHSGEVLDCRIDGEESSFLHTKIQYFNKFSLAIECHTLFARWPSFPYDPTRWLSDTRITVANSPCSRITQCAF
jgi:hypothetical protein